MPDLRPDQLESIHRLLLDPLRDAVRTELRLTHAQLKGAIDALTERVTDHAHRTERRLAAVERQTMRLRDFRRRLLALYTVASFFVTAVWSLLRDKLLSKLGSR